MAAAGDGAAGAAAERAWWVADKSAFTQSLGLKIEELRRDYCRSRLPRRPELLNQGGTFHGGLFAVVADHTAGVAASTCVGEDERVVTSEYKINILRPGDCAALVTVGGIIKTGKRLIIGEAKVYGESDGGDGGGGEMEKAPEENPLLAVSLFTFAVVPRRGAGK